MAIKMTANDTTGSTALTTSAVRFDLAGASSFYAYLDAEGWYAYAGTDGVALAAAKRVTIPASGWLRIPLPGSGGENAVYVAAKTTANGEFATDSG